LRIKVNPSPETNNLTWGLDPYFHNDNLISVELFTHNNQNITLVLLARVFQAQINSEFVVHSKDSIEFIDNPQIRAFIFRDSSYIYLNSSDIIHISKRDSLFDLNPKSVHWNEWGYSWDSDHFNDFTNSLVDRHLK
jgi:hypothetical protein